MFAQLLRTARRYFNLITPPSSRKTFRPRVEILEDRLVLATATFLGGAGDGGWSNVANWQNQYQANTNDDVIVAAGANASLADMPGLQLNSLTVQNGALTVGNDLIVNALVTQTGGSVSVSEQAQLATVDYALSGGSLTFAGVLLIADELTQSGGTLTVAEVESLDLRYAYLSGGTLTGNGTVRIIANPGNPAQGGNLWIEDSCTISVASLGIDEHSTLTINGGFTLSDTVLSLGGYTAWVAGNINLQEDAQIINEGQIDILGGEKELQGLAEAGTIINHGTIYRNGTGSVTLSTELSNSGPDAVVVVHAGNLYLPRSTINTGTFQVDAGSELEFFALALNSSGTVFSGAGTVVFTRQATLAAGVTVTSTAPVRFQGLDNVLAGAGTFKSMTSLDWKSGTIINVTGIETWGEVTIRGDINQGIGGKTIVNSTLTNHALLSWNDIGDFVLTNSVFLNEGTFNINSSNSILGTPGSLIRNRFNGIMRLLGAPFVPVIDVPVINEGLLLLDGGGLLFKKGITQQGGVTNLADGRLYVDQGYAFTLQAGEIQGGGTIFGALTATNGIINVGDNPLNPKLKVTGQYHQSGSAVLRVTIQRDGQGTPVWGLLDAEDDIHFGGTIQFVMPQVPLQQGDNGVIIKWKVNKQRTGQYPPVQGWTFSLLPGELKVTKN